MHLQYIDYVLNKDNFVNIVDEVMKNNIIQHIFAFSLSTRIYRINIFICLLIVDDHVAKGNKLAILITYSTWGYLSPKGHCTLRCFCCNCMYFYYLIWCTLYSTKRGFMLFEVTIVLSMFTTIDRIGFGLRDIDSLQFS